MAQWITRLTTDQKIAGSNPARLVFSLLFSPFFHFRFDSEYCTTEAFIQSIRTFPSGVAQGVSQVIPFPPSSLLRMVYDQHTGRSKGFAFCEYQDQETAQSAIRNLHDVEVHGRRLKFDSAANAPDERHKGE